MQFGQVWSEMPLPARRGSAPLVSRHPRTSPFSKHRRWWHSGQIPEGQALPSSAAVAVAAIAVFALLHEGASSSQNTSLTAEHSAKGTIRVPYLSRSA